MAYDSSTVTSGGPLSVSSPIVQSIGGSVMVGFGADAAVGFFGVGPVTQPTAAAETTGYTAGTSTAVTIDGTFTGGVGTTAYTIGDIVAALKTLGVIAK